MKTKILLAVLFCSQTLLASSDSTHFERIHIAMDKIADIVTIANHKAKDSNKPRTSLNVMRLMTLQLENLLAGDQLNQAVTKSYQDHATATEELAEKMSKIADEL